MFPKGFGFIEIFGVRGILAIDLNALIGVESELLGLEDFVHIGNALAEAFAEAIEDLARGAGIGDAAGGNGEVAEIGPIMLEFGEVGLEQLEMLAVERFDVAVVEFTGDGSIERLT